MSLYKLMALDILLWTTKGVKLKDIQFTISLS